MGTVLRKEGKKREYDPGIAEDEWRKEGTEGRSLAAVQYEKWQEASVGLPAGGVGGWGRRRGT